MDKVTQRSACADLRAAGFDAERASAEVWEALLSAGAMIEAPEDNPRIFASGLRATLKVDAEVLDRKPKQRAIIMGHVAAYPCVQNADLLLYVPDGMRRFTNDLGCELGKDVAQAERMPGKSRYDFFFPTHKDSELALNAKRPQILEDVVTTLGSVAGMVKLLLPEQQDIHSLAFLLRGEVNPNYQTGVTDHYLHQRKIPTNAEEFIAELLPWELELFNASRPKAH